MGAPVLGAICNAGHEGAAGGPGLGAVVSTTQATASRFQLSMGYRWQDSLTHFNGDEEQKQRVGQDTQMQNKLHLFDVALSYRVSPRWQLNVGAPIIYVDRINQRAETVTHSQGMGDMSVGAKFWLFRPPTETQQNIQFGFAVKLPTGNPHVTDFPRPNGREAAPDAGFRPLTTVDQSIQLGDSGTGITLDYMAFKSIQRFTIFSTGAWLMNPRNTYRADTPNSRELSVPDQYLWQAGLGYAVPKLNGLAFTGTARMEGVPARDIIGREDGFRRPGYAVSVGPGMMYSRGRNTWSVTAPIAVKRDRTRSVPDYRSGGHGDAAFADYAILIGFTTAF